MEGALEIIVIVIALLGTLATFSCLRHAGRINSEISRKLVHTFMGTVILSFPWLFKDLKSIIVLCVLITGILFTIRYHSRLRSLFGIALHDIDRRSWGDFYFPISVTMVFWISDNDPVLFGIPILLMTFADSAAALTGKDQSPQKKLLSNSKTNKGSVGFFVVGSLVTSIWLLFFSNLGAWHLILTAALVSMITMLVERIATRGLDNLFVPLAASVLLPLYISSFVSEMLIQFLVIGVCIGTGHAFRKFISPKISCASILVIYVLWLIACALMTS
jgi:phytol kinase